MNGILDQFLKIDSTSMWLPAISIAEKILRPLIVYFFLIVALRVSGKREMAQIKALLAPSGPGL